jgi:hypothetical protein
MRNAQLSACHCSSTRRFRLTAIFYWKLSPSSRSPLVIEIAIVVWAARSVQPLKPAFLSTASCRLLHRKVDILVSTYQYQEFTTNWVGVYLGRRYPAILSRIRVCANPRSIPEGQLLWERKPRSDDWKSYKLNNLV